MKEFGHDQVKVYPNVSVLQVAAAKISRSWEHMVLVSLHGRRDAWPLFQALRQSRLVGVYTDSLSSPDALARNVLERCGSQFIMHVFENLGAPEERVRSLPLDEALGYQFASLNFVIFEPLQPPEIPLHIGLDDQCYIHEQGMMTKKEIRAVGIANLNIHPWNTVWDLGTGCGTLAIESSLLVPYGRVYAVEKNPQRVLQVRENIKRTGAYTVEVVQGCMPKCLENLPDPDRIFIGGGCGRDISVLKEAVNRIKSKGRIVLHTVLQGSLDRIIAFCRHQGLIYGHSTIQVCRSQVIANDTRLVPLNPVSIVTIDT
jgi:precorrin-6Y C5,15-methyltransferase (decarboxylating)